MLATSVWSISVALSDPAIRSPLRAPFVREFVDTINRTWSFFKIPHPRDSHPDFPGVSQRRAEWQLDHVQRAAQIAAISIRHAVFEKLIQDLLVVSMGLSRKKVIGDLLQRKLTLSEIHGKSTIEVENIAIASRLAELDRSSLREKWKALNALEPPMTDMNEQALYANGEIDEFDSLRHDAVHRFELTQPTDRIGVLLQMIGGIATILPLRLARNHQFTLASNVTPSNDDPFFGDPSWIKLPE